MLNINPIAGNTFRLSVSSGLFWLLLVLGLATLTFLFFIPFYTFKEDVKMFKDVGCALVQALALLLVLVSASRAVDEEFENKTAVTLLAKPVRDWELLVGKFVGIAAAALLLVFVLGIGLEITTFFRQYQDDFWRRRSVSGRMRETLFDDMIMHTWSVLPCLVLVALQTVVMAAVGVVLSVRLPLAPNLVAGLLVFVFGHMTPVIDSWTTFRIDTDVLQRMRAAKVSEAVLVDLTRLSSKRWPDEASFRADVLPLLGPADREAHLEAILDSSAGWAARNPWLRRPVQVMQAVVPDLERAYNVIDAVAYKDVVFDKDVELKSDQIRWGDIWHFVLSSVFYTLTITSALLVLGTALLRRREVSS